MASPYRYQLSYDFTGFQQTNPTTPLPADKIEIEFTNIETSIGQTITNLNLIQRSDGKLNNEIVTFDSLDSATKALLGTTMNPRGAWVTATQYKKLDLVGVGQATYLCVTDHTSNGSFTTDLTAGKWLVWVNPGFVDGTSFFQALSGTGSQTVFTVSQDMGTDENGLIIFVNNGGWVPQKPTAFTINGTSLTFSAAPPSGTDNIYVFAPVKLLSQAASYANAASASASAAASSASTAATQAGNASTSATNAANSASTASTQAGNAATSATNAATSAGNAATSASNASTAATNAGTYSTNAGTSATNAATSATNAGNSATAASGSASSASAASVSASAAASAAAASALAAANAAARFIAPRLITSGASATFSDGDVFIGFKSATASAKTLTLGAPTQTQSLDVKDAQGTAGTYPITITASGCTIDGGASLVIDNNYGAMSLKWDGISNWMVY